MKMDDSGNLEPAASRPTEAVFAALGLCEEAIAALQHQGYVTSEKRRKTSVVFKLRYRLHGQQRVCYIGTDPLFAATIVQALDVHQRMRQIEATLRTLAAQSRRSLRENKQKLAPLVEQAGWKFHGRDLRRPRGSGKACRPSNFTEPPAADNLASRPDPSPPRANRRTTT